MAAAKAGSSGSAGDIGLVQPVRVAEAALEGLLLDKRKVNCVGQEDHE
jgi:hypothetical protein